MQSSSFSGLVLDKYQSGCQISPGPILWKVRVEISLFTVVMSERMAWVSFCNHLLLCPGQTLAPKAQLRYYFSSPRGRKLGTHSKEADDHTHTGSLQFSQLDAPIQHGREWNLGNCWSDSSLYIHRLESPERVEMAFLTHNYPNLYHRMKYFK